VAVDREAYIRGGSCDRLKRSIKRKGWEGADGEKEERNYCKGGIRYNKGLRSTEKESIRR